MVMACHNQARYWRPSKAETLLARGSYGMEYGSPDHFLLIFPFAFTALAYATFPCPT